MSVTSVSYAVDGWGVGELWFEEERLAWHELPRPRAPARSSIGTRARARTAPVELVRRVQSYFGGEHVAFDDVELVADSWTPFQRDVLEALRAVPYGEVVSYADVAWLAGHPRAQRAVGTFCAHNRFGLIVPCHRVVSSAGIGSYGSLGVEYKRRLLALEGVTL